MSMSAYLRRCWAGLGFAGLAFVLGACARFEPIVAPEVWVKSPTLGERALEGSVLDGVVTVYLSTPDEAASVQYFLDVEPSPDHAIVPQNSDFSFSLDTRALANGGHVLSTATTIYGDAEYHRVVAKARFAVANGPSEKPVINEPPTVDAGPDLETVVGVPLALQGSASDDGVPAPLSTVWTIQAGSEGVMFDDPSSVTAVATFPMEGEYTVRLSASDGLVTVHDDVLVHVRAGEAEEPSPRDPSPQEPVPGQPPAGPGGPSPEFDHLEQIFVAVGGSDSNPGTEDRPLRTVKAGLQAAYEAAKRGKGARVLVMPGAYREAITGDFWSSRAQIVVEAYQRNTAVISGSDVFTDWSCSAARCEHHWPYDWGAASNPWPSSVEIGELALRRELVVIDGKQLEQVRLEDQLTRGSFYVDESRDRLVVVPPEGVDMRSATVEVGVRPTLWRTQGLSGLVLDGLVFTHAASPFRGGAVEIVDQRDVVLRNLVVVQNGQNGLEVSGGDLEVRDAVLSDNGSSGISGYRVTDSRFERLTIERNNWRGARGGYVGWEVGNKFLSAHRVTFSNVVSRGNLSRGFWLDTDNSDVRIEGAELCDNLRDGIFVEANQGPITIADSVLCDNGESGLLTSIVRGLQVVNTRIAGNGKAQLRISGDVSKVVRDFETGRSHEISDSAWHLMGNTMQEAGGGRLISITIPGSHWSSLSATSTFDNNDYRASTTRQFQLPGGSTVDLPGWQSRTGLDRRSSFTQDAYASNN